MRGSTYIAPALVALVAGGAALLSGTAAAEPTTSAASTTADVTATDAATAFTDCMRAHGLPDFPTATVTADGRVTLHLGTTGIDPFSATYRSALKACSQHLPAASVMPSDPIPPTPEAPSPPPVPAVPTVR